MENYNLLHTALLYDRIPVSEYISRRTGLTVVIAEVEGPSISAEFQIITEAFDDDGLPDVLRHLIFMGSEDFPYKDIPNLIAASFGSEVTSRTKTDHTTYTIETVVHEGLLSLLPIIGDYLLFPLLMEEAFITEIHHITKEGDDAGTMYEKLKSSENFGRSRLLLTLIKNIYPGKCSYASNIEGMTKSLLESVTITKVRNYHKKYYRPENLKIVITGKIKPEKVFKALEKLEEKIVSKGPRDCFQRPFQTLPAPLTEESKNIVIKYPADSEAKGCCYIGWRTVCCITNSYTLLAITLLLEYLVESPVSLLFKELVNGAYINRVEYDVIKNKESCVYVLFNDIPIEKLPEINRKLQAVFEKIITYKDIDMECLQTIITQFKFKEIIRLENYPDHEIQSILIKYAAFGKCTDFQHCFNPLPEMDKLLEEPQSFWLGLVQKYFLQNKHVALQCIPSKEERKNIAEKDKVRLDNQKRNLAEAESIQRAEILKKAVTLNQQKPPPELLISIPLPSMESIRFHNIERHNSDSKSNQNQRIDLTQTPVFTYFDHVNASTVFLQAFSNTSKVPTDLQNYLPLLYEGLMELPIERNGVIIPHEDIVKQLDADIIYKWTDPRSYCMPHLAVVCVEVEAAKYEIGLRWLGELLYKTVFTAERVKIVAARMLKELGSNTGYDTVYHAINLMCFSKDSHLIICGGRRQRKFLTDLIEKLDADDGTEVLNNIEKVRKIVSDPSNVTLYIAANLDIVKDPVGGIEAFLPPELVPSEKKQKLNSLFDYNFLQFNESIHGAIIGDTNTKHTSFSRVTKTITSYMDPDYAPLTVYINYLDQAEGPLRKQLQATTFWLHVNIEEGLMYLTFPKAKDIVEAYKKTKEVIEKLESGGWDEALLKSTQRTILNELIEGEGTIMDIVLLSRKAYFHNLDYTYHRQIFDAVVNVTVEDLRRVGEKYVAPLFDARRSKTAILVHPSRIVEVAEEFNKSGLDLKVYDSVESLEESFE